MNVEANKYDHLVECLQQVNHNNLDKFLPEITGQFLPPDYVQPFHKKIDDFLNFLNAACLQLDDLDGFVKKIDRDDIIEIYETSMVQYWRSINFFEQCSYTPEELFCTPWFELFERPDFVNERIFGFVKEVMESQLSNVKYTVPNHLLKETRGNKNIIEMELRYCSVLKDLNGRPFGFVSTVKAKKRTHQKTFLQSV